MAAIKKSKLQWLKGLMVFSQVVLVLFTGQWLYSQYAEQQEQLKKNLTKVFTDVQQKISDSLYLANVVGPVGVGSPTPVTIVALPDSEESRNVGLSNAGRYKILSSTMRLSGAEEKRLFKVDTIVFNELFTSQMRQNGWNFNSEWINSSDSNKKAAGALFINSNYFTDTNGIVVSNYRHYIFWKLLPQMFFVLVLLSLTATAFVVTFKSLKAQIKLGFLKDDFISNMSHELKTPIATVKVALEALNNYNIIDDPKLGREYLGMATSEMDRLELLATRVLNTSLLETGKIYLQQESHDLKELVDGVLLGMQPRLRQHGAKVSFYAGGDHFPVHVDMLHMQGVLVNLIDNSLKYGIAPVQINIDLSLQDGKVRLALTDNGPGIPEEYKEKVFEKFFRVPTGNLHNTKGYGLSYVAQVMRQHKGNIAVNNIAAGGCMFTLTF
jgi:signal transduction histidine kinase